MDCSFISEPGQIDEAFRQGMRRLATTVSIITLQGEDAQPLGMTATAVTSLSAEPLSLLACVNRSTSIHDLLALGTPFCINLLSEGHGELSTAFGGRLPQQERFSLGGWETGNLAYLKDAQANFACTVDAVFAYGTHSIVVGRIAAVRISGEFAPLVYGNGSFLPTMR